MIVLDTCVVIWLSEESPLISKAAAERIEEARKSEGLSISGITLYELAWLIENARITIASSSQTFLADAEARFQVLPVTARIAQLAVGLPDSYPADPMDRIIGATALAHNGKLITRDKAIRKSKAVPVVW